MAAVESIEMFGLLVLGTLLGILVGAIPGLTGAMLISLTLPFTFQLSGSEAIVLLVSMYVGAVSGGLISAIVLRIPGTPAAMVTTLDGYPLAQSGRADRALGLGIGASFLGGMISFGFLYGLAGPIARGSTLLGPFETFGLVLVAMVMIASVGGKSLWAGLFSGAMGMAVSLPGLSPATGELRYTFGIPALADGFKLLPVLIGLFAVNGVFRSLCQAGEAVAPRKAVAGGVGLAWRDLRLHWGNGLRSSVIGTWIGVLPGIGANIGSAVAYGIAQRFSRHPDRFGKGAEEGIVASESANNATVGGALIPLVSLGIPGSVIDAILLGALVIHGLQPGPLLFTNHPEIVQSVMSTYFWANGVMLVFMLLMARRLVRLGNIPSWILIPCIMTFCVIGTYSLGNRMFDVWVMLVFGVLGFALECLAIPLAPFVIGLVLAPLAEENLSAGLMSSGGSWGPLFTRPISLGLVLVSVVLLVVPVVMRARRQSRAQSFGEAEG